MPSTVLSAEETMNEIAQNPWPHEVYASMTDYVLARKT